MLTTQIVCFVAQHLLILITVCFLMGVIWAGLVIEMTSQWWLGVPADGMGIAAAIVFAFFAGPFGFVIWLLVKKEHRVYMRAQAGKPDPRL